MCGSSDISLPPILTSYFFESFIGEGLAGQLIKLAFSFQLSALSFEPVREKELLAESRCKLRERNQSKARQVVEF